MPVFGPGPDQAPPWCELEQFDIVDLAPGETYRFDRRSRRELIIVTDGDCRLAAGDAVIIGRRGVMMELPTDAGTFEVTHTVRPTTLVRMAGRWGDDYRGAGLFIVGEGDNRSKPGDPVEYPKTTRFDNHYHDLDEYWIFYEGRGVVYSEGIRYDVGPGDCIATGTGHHHDVSEVFDPVLRGVWLETTPLREKRRGHLWEHTHGAAVPDEARV